MNGSCVERENILGSTFDRPTWRMSRPGYHYIYVYRCRICGATKAKNDRWSPLQ